MNAFADHWDFHEQSFEQWRRWQRDREFFDPTLWFLALDGDEIAGFALCAPHFSGAGLRLGRSARRSAGVAAAGTWRGASPGTHFERSTCAASRGSGSASTPRARRERRGSTSGSGCDRSAARTPGSCVREPASRALPRLPDAHGRRDRTRVSVPLAAAANSAPASCECPRLGQVREAMAEAAWLELPYPEAGVVEASSLAEQTLMVAAELPDRPLVLGGCCCAHLGRSNGLPPATRRLPSSGSTPTAI